MCSAFRCEAYLPATIESVLAQSSTEWELVVVDNGMSDTIAGIVERYAVGDPRVRLLRQENRRLVGGMATAARAARGRYLVPLCSDDLLHPEFCRRMAEVLDTRSEIDVLSCDSYLFVDGEQRDMVRTFLRTSASMDHPLTLLDLVGRHDVVPYFAAFRREAWFAGGGYAEGTDLVEDIALFLKLVAAGHDVRVLPEQLARYRMRDDSASRDPSAVEQFERSREQIYADAARSTGDPATLRALDVRLRVLRYEQSLRRARWAFTRGDVAAARAAAAEAFRQRPTLRSAVVRAALVAPRLLRAVHPVKQDLGVRAARLAAWLMGRKLGEHGSR